MPAPQPEADRAYPAFLLRRRKSEKNLTSSKPHAAQAGHRWLVSLCDWGFETDKRENIS